MTAQEQQMLQGLAERINGTQLPEKDADAEQYLQQTLGRNPDAMYILAQTVLVQQYALTQAQKQLADAKAEADQLRQQAQQPKHSTSFLGSLLGRSDEPARPAPPPPPPPAYAQPQYTPVPPPPPPAYAPAYGAPAYGAPVSYGAPPSQTGGFLRGAAQTAAGVAAGALAFEGVESLMHGFGHEAGYGSDMGLADSVEAAAGPRRSSTITTVTTLGARIARRASTMPRTTVAMTMWPTTAASTMDPTRAMTRAATPSTCSWLRRSGEVASDAVELRRDPRSRRFPFYLALNFCNLSFRCSVQYAACCPADAR